ncbi:hypothetical protein [Amycolatopsis sp. MtRt-6]|uniref:hypothetical protein n=1 Tax=Amycolatopsis sp. MtRt-6 TaxID=2792782 RepID=UPI001A909791|nr:hypothetical protein [Amycolatopsis sp. MtRt-6]
MSTLRTRTTMRLLATFETLFAASAVYGGISLVVGAPGFTMPVEWLAPLGLTSWVLPGIALALGIGGTLAWASVFAWRIDFRAPIAALAACGVLTGWLAIQFGVIGVRAPVQWVTAGLVIALLGLALLARHGLSRDHVRRDVSPRDR